MPINGGNKNKVRLRVKGGCGVKERLALPPLWNTKRLGRPIPEKECFEKRGTLGALTTSGAKDRTCAETWKREGLFGENRAKQKRTLSSPPLLEKKKGGRDARKAVQLCSRNRQPFGVSVICQCRKKNRGTGHLFWTKRGDHKPGGDHIQ